MHNIAQKFSRVLLVCSLSTAFISTHLQAAVVSYDEAIDGDISFATSALMFDVGVNTITGSTTLNSPGFDFDDFSFDVANGTQINSVSYAFSNVVIRPGTLGFGLSMHAADGDLGDVSINIATDVSPVSILDDSLPIGEGGYEFNYSLWRTGTSADPYGATWDYTVTFDVGSAAISAVPIPSAVWLFGSGVLGLISVSRRKS